MIDGSKTYRIFISAAEPSADAHCAGLITALKAKGYSNIEFVGVGGPGMARAGCTLLQVTISKAVMIYNAFVYLWHYYTLIRRISRYLKRHSVDLVIVCDSPSFNFHVAKAAKKAGITTLFYVAPQLWAWASWRIRKLRRRCDRLCCILPFEQDWFSRRGVDTVFVGNPMLDGLQVDSACRRDYADFSPCEQLIVALMPGSRTAEIDTLWQPMQQIALHIRQKYPAAKFITVAVDVERRQILQQRQIPNFECEYIISSVHDTAGQSDFTIVASGSATLQVAAAGCPMVIMYQSSRILWHLAGRFIVKTPYLSLVNILSNKELVPEFMPYFTSTEAIAETVESLLADKDKLIRLSNDLVALVEPLAEKKACEEVADLVAEMLQ